MGEGQRTSGPAVTETQDPEQLRAAIEESRQELGETVEALAAKTDVKAQASRKMAEARASAVGKKEELLGKAKGASPEGVSATAAHVSQKARENPVPMTALGAFGAGFLAGRMSKRRGRRR